MLAATSMEASQHGHMMFSKANREAIGRGYRFGWLHAQQGWRVVVYVSETRREGLVVVTLGYVHVQPGGKRHGPNAIAGPADCLDRCDQGMSAEKTKPARLRVLSFVAGIFCA